MSEMHAAQRNQATRIRRNRLDIGHRDVATYELRSTPDALEVVRDGGACTLAVDRLEVSTLEPDCVVVSDDTGALVCEPVLSTDRFDLGSVAADIVPAESCAFSLEGKWDASMCAVDADTVSVGHVSSSLVPSVADLGTPDVGVWTDLHVRDARVGRLEVASIFRPDDASLGLPGAPFSKTYADVVHCRNLAVNDAVETSLIPTGTAESLQALGRFDNKWNVSHVGETSAAILDVERCVSSLVPTPASTRVLGTEARRWDEIDVLLLRADQLENFGEIYRIAPPGMSGAPSPAPKTYERDGYVLQASSEYSSSFNASKACNKTNMDDGDCWHSATAPPQWLQISFPEPVDVAGYSVRGRYTDVPDRQHFPRSWRLEGRLGGGAWTMLDERTDDASIDSPGGKLARNVGGAGLVDEVRLTVTKTSYNRVAIGEFDVTTRHNDELEIAGDGGLLSNLNASNLSHGIVPNDRMDGDYDVGDVVAIGLAGDGSRLDPLDASAFSHGTLADVLNGTYHVTELFADLFGDGSNVTNLNADELSTGYVPSDRMPDDINVGTLEADHFFGNAHTVTSLNASELRTGRVSDERVASSYGTNVYTDEQGVAQVGIPYLDRVVANVFYGSGANLTDLPVSEVVGVVDDVHLPTDPVFNSVTATAAGGFKGRGAAVTALNASKLASGTVGNSRVSGSYGKPSTVVTLDVITANKFVGDGSQLTNMPSVAVGTILMWLESTPPTGWLKLQGGTFDRNKYPALYTYLGTTSLPDWSGRYAVQSGGHATGALGSFLSYQTKLPVAGFRTNAMPDTGTRTFGSGKRSNAYSSDDYGNGKSAIQITGGDSTTRPLSTVLHHIIYAGG